MNVSDFDFHLPAELVAQEAATRGTSRLFVLDRATGRREHRTISELPAHIAPGDLLVVNDTRVFPARLLGRRVPSGGAVECLLLGRIEEHGDSRWEALVHPGQKLRSGERVRFADEHHALMAEILERKFYGRRIIRLWSESDEPVDAAIDALGHVPLPPYIHRPDRLDDRERYQTVYARARGSVAAPTAGLHFTEEILAALDRRGIERVAITLHVGYGTFKPVRVATVEEHTVDPEPYEISASAASSINAALDQGRRIIAVGTTTTRALEDAARVGNGRVRAGRAMAEIFVYPGFDFRVIRGLLTNFHLPQSSLLMLVAAFAGRARVLDAYREAVKQRYRFYSYGDAMLIV